jgi:cytochrome c-type biogenesis protein CcmH
VTVFVVLCIVLAALAVAWLVLPLVRARDTRVIDRAAFNVGILKDQRAELERDLARGAIGDTAFAEAHAELERRVLEESAPAAAAISTGRGARRSAIAIAAGLPVAALLLYLAFGARHAFDPEITEAKTAQQLTELLMKGDADTAIEQINAQLKRASSSANTGDLLFILARAHTLKGQFKDAAAAYEKLNEIAPDEPTLLTDWADVIALSQGRSMKGRPEQLVDRALSIEPDHSRALAMAGAAAYERGDYAAAVAKWEKLRERAAGTEITAQLDQSIAQARAAGNLPRSLALAKKDAGTKASDKAVDQARDKPSTNEKGSAGTTVSGRVSVDAAVAKNAAPGDTVFIVARAASGPRAPLAVKRLQVKDLPMQFVLDDSLAMAPEFKLSGFSEVIVTARVSKNGDAMPKAGDLEAQSVAVKVGAKDVALLIDRVRQ